ncbi:hypothetical protein [Sphingomonas sp. M1-B02]|uniref:hypothetical protein n=1 Tax=Sphingomonas sp. M1-B02 TaxID=3114300 RepID=UPI00223F250C|nr:hypothetical protein [Sphingomonas sp. S6-11]UZK65556.1 hypothetical protein OKW87_13710 [Sphingomonas sp. S6-11]
MSAEFSITVDPSVDLVRMQMGGLFAPEDIQDFLEMRRRAHAELRCAPNQHLTLNDLRAMKIQPQESVARFQEVLADPVYRSRRLAFVIGRTLARSQLLRALCGRGAYCFDTVADAEAWLFAEKGAPPLRQSA